MPSSQPTNPRHVLVTGASRGIGKSIAAAFVEAGETVTVLARTADKAATAAAEIGAVGCVAADVTDAPALQIALANAARQAGPVDVLVSNVGGVETAPLARTDTELLRRMMALNLEPLLVAARAVVPGMSARGTGRIIAIASTAGLKGYGYVSAYCAAKHAVVGLTRALAVELAATGITVNAVCPGYTDTDLVAGALDALQDRTGRSREELIASFVKGTPLGRLIRPEEVADCVVWLAGSAASAITGQAVAVAGGEL